MTKKLLKIFNVKNLFQLAIVFFVFAVTGSLSVVLGKYVVNFFIGENFADSFLFWFLRILLIFPLYQFLLIIVGTVFGQFKYFWELEKKMLQRMRIIKSSRS